MASPPSHFPPTRAPLSAGQNPAAHPQNQPPHPETGGSFHRLPSFLPSPPTPSGLDRVRETARGPRSRHAMATTRPARSDPHLPPEEAARVEAEVRGYFDSLAPRRPAKPPRSDPSEAGAGGTEVEADGGDLPELRRLRDLEAKPQKLVLDGGDVNGEEYVETQYYDGLNCIDKQHHTTGTGFIKVERPNGNSFNVTTVAYSSDSLVHCTSNPATNDWIPSSETVWQ
ncbi:hypothetical protein GUJ93_ZPchr0005g16131 [Zizania palustris]|uniref:Uncharacterized protein n=1 Tax=Zizania palustris TaxID=103762 RepID=A0A8J5T8Y4_ZIZPA|nr:hypothetical protein GUJ93_ZPchr0005g16131 [Zizania palustris]